VTDSDGAVGVAEAVARPYIYGETIDSIMALYTKELPALCVGQPIWARERIRQRLDGAFVHNHSAKAALDMALTDLCCRRLEVSCNQYLGAWTDEQEVTQLVGHASPDEAATTCLRLREQYGLRSFKVKVGQGIATDAAVLSSIRAGQPDALIYIDANRAYGPVEALELEHAVADLGVRWIEEPVSADLPLGRRRVAAIGRLAVLGDESCTTPGEVAREVLAGRSHLVSLKPARTGYLLSDQIRGFCESVGAPLVVGTQGESGIGTLANLSYTTAHQSTSRYPGELGFFMNLEDDLLAEPLRIENGRLRLLDAPGNGAVVDPAKVERYRIR
jgi:L-alanine-DL-glutamate epimerase-like enolase superfamily enzyme